MFSVRYRLTFDSSAYECRRSLRLESVISRGVAADSSCAGSPQRRGLPWSSANELGLLRLFARLIQKKGQSNRFIHFHFKLCSFLFHEPANQLFYDWLSQLIDLFIHDPINHLFIHPYFHSFALNTFSSFPDVTNRSSVQWASVTHSLDLLPRNLNVPL